MSAVTIDREMSRYRRHVGGSTTVSVRSGAGASEVSYAVRRWESASMTSEFAIVDPSGAGAPVLVSPATLESLVETIEVLADPVMRDALAISSEQVRRGETRSWEEIEEELGL